MTAVMKQLGFILSAVVVATVTAPAVAKEEPTKPDPAKLAATVKDLFRSRCFDCHGGNSTQNGIAVLDRDSLVKKGAVVPGKPDESSLYRAITDPDEDSRMPEGQPALSAGEIESVRQWIVNSAPAYPEDVLQPKEAEKDVQFKGVSGVEYVLREILAHQRTLSGDERRFTRYFSCNHLLTAGATRETVSGQRDAFFKAINHLSRERDIVRPTIVNGDTGTIFALDLRKTGWHKQPFKTGDASAADGTNLYDLVLIEYPYGIAYEDSTVFDTLATEYLLPAGMIRPIPYVRSDWFCSIATLPPLYHDLMQLPRTLAELEKELNVDTESNLKQRVAKRAGMTVSGVSRNNRAVERHPSPLGSFWKSVDYASSKGSENIFVDPVNLRGTGGEMIFTLPNGLQGYFVCDAKGGRLNDAPTSIVTDKFAEDKTVRNGLSCIRCHDRGMKDFKDEVRPAVEGIAGSGHIDKHEVLAQYPPQSVMEKLLEEDRQRFLSAMEKALGASQPTEPLISVTQRFLDAPLQLTAVAGELGLTNDQDLRTTFRLPGFAAFGLVALGNSGVVRRDMWEDYFDHVVRNLGLGIPLLPIDGITRPDYLPSSSTISMVVSTDRKNNVFSPGDEFAVFVENMGKATLFVELVGSGTKGEKVILVPAGTEVAAGAKFRFPQTGSIKVQSAAGKERITVFASETKFEPGRILRAPNVEDRVVHPLYRLVTEGGRTRIKSDAKTLVKRTIEFETR